MNLGSESGTFTSATWPVVNAWGSSAYTMVGDFDGDGKADIASAVGGSIQMKLSTGTGFRNDTWVTLNRWGSTALVADLNGDNKDDIVSFNDGASAVYVKLSSGTGFTDQTWTIDAESPGIWRAVGDFTRDGKADILILNGCTLKLYESTGAGFVKHLS
jgi:hypothetical protein